LDEIVEIVAIPELGTSVEIGSLSEETTEEFRMDIVVIVN